MAFAMAVIPLIDVFAKFLGQQGFPIPQLVWARFFFGALFTLPFAWTVERTHIFRPRHPVHLTARAALLILGTVFFFAGLKYLPIADTLAIYFISPILVTALSPLILKEKVGPHRWACVALGFIGVLIIIRPGFQAFNIGMLFALGAGCCSALYLLLTRHLTASVNAMVMTFQTSAIGTVAMTLTLPFLWTPPDLLQWLMLIGIGFFAIVGHYFITRAYDMGEASLISPLSYLEMVTAVLLGWYFFDNFPDGWTFVGVAILIASAIYISVREHKLEHQAVDSPPNPVVSANTGIQPFGKQIRGKSGFPRSRE
jgi:drug/metabolite transporter (DMT)-like permease